MLRNVSFCVSLCVVGSHFTPYFIYFLLSVWICMRILVCPHVPLTLSGTNQKLLQSVTHWCCFHVKTGQYIHAELWLEWSWELYYYLCFFCNLAYKIYMSVDCGVVQERFKSMHGLQKLRFRCKLNWDWT